MRQILFALLLLSLLITPNRVSAQAYCRQDPNGVWGCAHISVGPGQRAVCPSSQDANCRCIPNIGGGVDGQTVCTVAPEGTTSNEQKAVCPGPNCAAGQGQSCNANDGRRAGSDGDGILTAIGCIPTEPQALVTGVIRYGTLAAGGIAFLIMILAAFQMITAEGNPQSVKGAQEKFYSAIIGLLLVIFSVLLMQVIGVDLLGLPGFGRN